MTSSEKTSGVKWKLFDDFSITYNDLISKPYFGFIPFTVADVTDLKKDTAVPEMHARIITGLARRFGVPLITSDPQIVASGLVKIVW